MRSLRAALHVVLALALIALGVAPSVARLPAPIAGASATEHGSHHQVAMAAHDRAPSRDDHSTHKRETCQAACCFMPSEPPARTDGFAVALFCGVRYSYTDQPMAGRSSAPDPGIPKNVA